MPTPVRAQDGWAITREPRSTPASQGVASAPGERALRSWLANPEDDLSFERVLAQRSALSGGHTQLEARLRAERARRATAAEPTWALARLLLSLDRWSEANELLATSLSEGRDPAGTLLFRARLQRMRGARVEASEDLARVLERGSATARQREEALRGLGELALEQGKLDEARHHYRKLAESVASDWQRACEFPRALVKLGRLADALPEYRALTTPFERQPRIAALLWLELARTELAANQPEAARQSLARATELDPRLEPELRTLQVEAWRRTGLLEEAALQREREAKAGRVDAWREAAALWQERADGARAALCLRAMLALRPSDLDARGELASLLRRESDFVGAEAQYRELTRRAPGVPRFVTGLAELLHASGRGAEALTLLARASRKQPRAAALHVAVRELYVRWGEHALADRELTLLAKLEPDNPMHALAVAERALAAGDRSAAISAFTKLHAGGDARSEVELARVLEQHDLLPEAIQHARRALELAPAQAESQRLLAGLLERASRESEAEAAWRALLTSTSADDEARREARRHLALLWRRSGRLAERTAELESQLSGSVGDPAQLWLLAELYARDPSKVAKEIAVLERLLSQQPGDGSALRALEQAELRRGALGAALRALERQLALACTDCGERVRHALDLAREYVHDEQAPALVARVVALRPQDASVMAAAGEFHALRADWARSRAAYERAVELDPQAHAARHALLRDALRRGEPVAAREQLRAIVLNGGDDALVSDALALLVPAGGELEPWLIERALAAPERAALRRFVLERALLPWLPVARRVRMGEGSALELEQLTERVVALRGVLLAALDAPSASERLLAIALLAAVPHPAALEPLLRIAEHEERSLQERAEALLALGSLRRAAAVDRLRALAREASRPLRPLALWALSESVQGAAPRELQEALEQRDDAVRAMAALLVGVRGDASRTARLRELVGDPHETVRAAALWALSREQPASHEPALATLLTSRSELALVALAALVEQPRHLAEALFSLQPSVRARAVELSRAAPNGTKRPPAPSWPFDVRGYLVRVAVMQARALPPAASAQDGAIAESAAARLQGAPEQLTDALGLLVPAASGLSLLAFEEAGVCVSSERARWLAERLREPLAALTRSPQPSVRARALALLVMSGGGERPEVRAALRSGDRAQVDAVLSAAGELAAATPLPSQLREAIAPLLAAPEWPVRMRAASALRHTLTSSQLAHDPIALVRAAPAKAAPIPPCSGSRAGATN